MARMYARKKGRSGSRRPSREKAPEWVEYSKDEVETLVLKLRDHEMTSAQIGLVLRDQYGIPSVREITGKKITQILRENNRTTELPEELFNLLKKVVTIEDHLKSNRKDTFSQRGLQLNESKIRRLVKYYKRTNLLPQEWVYKKEQAKILTSSR